LSWACLRLLLPTGIALLPANVARRLLIDAPPLVLNLMLPGSAGALSAGLFEIARKISTVPLFVRQAFQYVMAPLSSAQARADRSQIGPLYSFASRVSTATHLYTLITHPLTSRDTEGMGASLAAFEPGNRARFSKNAPNALSRSRSVCCST
jgi:O-antigen/teichoic acid export membrane protein